MRRFVTLFYYILASLKTSYKYWLYVLQKCKMYTCYFHSFVLIVTFHVLFLNLVTNANSSKNFSPYKGLQTLHCSHKIFGNMNRLSALTIVFCVVVSHTLAQETCGLTNSDGVNSFTVTSASPLGEIPEYRVQFDTVRKIPITSTAIYSKLNLIQNVDRDDDPFRNIDCPILAGKQQNCSNTFRLTVAQKTKLASEYNSWDRGHLTPVNPMRYDAEAVSNTFFCVNIAPQEPWSNRCPWYNVEERALSRAKEYPPYYVMTGTCAEDSPDGVTYYGLSTPACYWKMVCYVDPTTKLTHVVAFVGNNSIISGGATRDSERTARAQTTILPRSQQEILGLMGNKAPLIQTAWQEAETFLNVGRNEVGLPSATTCSETWTLDGAVAQNWSAFMALHKKPFGC